MNFKKYSKNALLNGSFRYIFVASFGGALIQRAEIIPFEPDAVSTDEGTRV